MEKRRMTKSKAKDLLFYIALIALPLAQFIIFYIFVNINSFVLAFQSPSGNGLSLENFKSIFDTDWMNILLAARMSLITYAISLIVGVPLGIIFAYYIYKKCFGSSFFRVILYIPSILSVTVMVTFYYYFMNGKASDVLFNGVNPFTDERYQFLVVALFNVFMSFGNSVIMYTNKMTSINPEIIEAAHLDGAYGFSEFWHIVLPESFSTISVFLVTGVATIFTNQWTLYLFYSTGNLDPSLWTLGYYLFRKVSSATAAELGKYSALGLLMAFIAIPLTFLVRYLLNRFGPTDKERK